MTSWFGALKRLSKLGWVSTAIASNYLFGISVFVYTLHGTALIALRARFPKADALRTRLYLISVVKFIIFNEYRWIVAVHMWSMLSGPEPGVCYSS